MPLWSKSAGALNYRS